MSWWWRTKPRSIIRTIQWFPSFGALENKNWDEVDPTKISIKDKKKVHPVRRTYIYNAHSDEDTFLSSITFQKYLSGQYDSQETESNGRNDKTTFEFFGFGYVDSEGIIRVTNAGRRIIEGKFDDEDFLKQLLKLHFPNNIQTSNSFKDDDFIYPLEMVCKAVKRFEYLNRSELVLLFGCININDIDKTFDAIEAFRKGYNNLPNKNDTTKVKELCSNTYIQAYGKMENQLASYYDYAEALGRSLVYTGLFKATGRSIATKIRVPQYSMSKLDMIINKISFERKTFANVDDYMKWYGATDNIILPWDNVDERRNIIQEKIQSIRDLENNDPFLEQYEGNIKELVAEAISNAERQSSSNSMSNLKDAEKALTDFIVGIREQEYIRTISQTDKARQEILGKYDEIMDTIDMGALWLEVNTWKSLLALKGNKSVKRNFNIEEDLTPKSFAPGIGNTPDMEMYTDNFIIIPEVSLMTGVQQWEHEASSVIDHVLSFIKENTDKKVLGLFISNSINIRTKWQFFILNKESWVDETPVPVIPLTIKQYKGLIEVFYKKNLSADEFTRVIDAIGIIALSSKNYLEWFLATEDFIEYWKKKKLAA